MKLSKTNKFKKHYKQRVLEKDDKIFIYVLSRLLKEEELEDKFRNHRLIGKLKDFRGCHLRSDLLLIYQVLDDEVMLVDIGSHSQLFG
ncbi:MAG: type II toxin-antitoxin system YafQ family toxin [Thermosipho sp. (in: Bacteria)]|nr:type II toxin-antitoxin system YafQ family toxin [Thermosipho sp. (in: thermotogales)]